LRVAVKFVLISIAGVRVLSEIICLMMVFGGERLASTQNIFYGIFDGINQDFPNIIKAYES